MKFRICAAVSCFIAILLFGVLFLFDFTYIPKLNDKAGATAQSAALFDENNIVLRFGSLSDAHIGYGSNETILRNALDILKNRTSNKIDALLFSGDNTQNGVRNEAQNFANILREKFDLTKVAAVIANGNHDTYWSGCMTPSEFVDAYGQDIYSFDVDENNIRNGNRHVVVNGYHFITVQIQTFMPNYNNLSLQTKTWLENTLTNITENDPGKYVFVAAHSPALHTVYGSKEGDPTATWGGSADLASIINKYPQAILFSGHTHYAINREDSIMQQGATHITTGSLGQITLQDEGFFEAPQGNIPNDRSYSQGILAEVDSGGNVRITRIDFSKNETIKQPWILPAPKSDLSHLTHYTANRATQKPAPIFSSSAKITLNYRSEKEIDIVYDTANDTDMVHYYMINIYDSSDTVKYSIKSLSPWYMYPDLEKIPKTRTFRINDFRVEGQFIIRITAVDIWGNNSSPLSAVIKRDSEEEQADANEIMQKINELGEITADSKDAILQIRAKYNELSYFAKLLVDNYADFLEAENIFYNTYMVTRDIEKYLVKPSLLYSTAPSQTKASFTESQYNGVTITWNLSTNNQTVGINKAFKLDGLHMSFSNMAISSQNKSFGIIISNIVRDKYVNNNALLIYIDFATGSLYAVEKNNSILITKDDLLVYDNILGTPFDILIEREGNAFSIDITTILGNVKGTIPDAVILNVDLEDYENCYVSLTPWANNVSIQLDWLSIHDGKCVEDKQEEVEEEIPNNNNDTPKPSGCKGDMAVALPIIVVILFITKNKRSNIR